MMKSLFLLLFLCSTLLFISCGTSDDNTPEQENVVYDSVTDPIDSSASTDSMGTVVNKSYLWKVESQGDQQQEKLTEPRDSILHSFTPNQLVETLNASYPDVQIKFLQISHDTMYVSIPKSNALTDEMGSTGSYNYLATAVFNLTELKNISFVHFDFKAGDHGSPGTYSRKDFDRLR